MRTHLAIFVGTLTVSLLVGGTAFADNNITLQRFGVCQQTAADPTNPCASLTVNETGFRDFSRDLGLIMAPVGNVTPETLGQAGFAFQLDQSVHIIDSAQQYWIDADVEGNPSGTQPTTQFHFRKGLPMSVEIGTMWTLLMGSNLSAVGADIRWALHEDYAWPVPDLTIRGFANTVVGSRQLQMFNTGGDVLVGVPLGVADVMNITPFAGYNLTVIIASSRLIDATPNDLAPAQISQISPEFSFDSDSVIVHRGVGGVRFQAAIVDFTFQTTISSFVQSYSFSLGLNF